MNIEQLLDVLRPVSERAPETAKRLRQYLSADFQHGIVCGLVNGDPAAHVGKALRAPQKKHLPPPFSDTLWSSDCAAPARDDR